MKYVGSKNRLSKELLPIIQSYIKEGDNYYIEPFVGGANMIDKIKCPQKFGIDIHEELIELLKYVQVIENELPLTISEEEYLKVRDNKKDYPKWYVGLVGFCCGFGAKYFGGYARGMKADKITPRDLPNEAIRNLEKQRKDLKGIKFINGSYERIEPEKAMGCIVYCDPPYKGTLKYSTNKFNYNKFYDWCRKMAINNTVLISEYNMPDDFTCIWEKSHKVGINQGEHQERIEKLFIIKGEE